MDLKKLSIGDSIVAKNRVSAKTKKGKKKRLGKKKKKGKKNKHKKKGGKFRFQQGGQPSLTENDGELSKYNEVRSSEHYQEGGVNLSDKLRKEIEKILSTAISVKDSGSSYPDLFHKSEKKLAEKEYKERMKQFNDDDDDY